MQVCFNVSSIVYQNSWLEQTTGFSDSAIFTPSSDGLYRVSIGLYVVGSSGNPNVDAKLSFPANSTASASWNTVSANVMTSSPVIPESSGGNVNVGVFVGKSGLDIPLSVVISGGTINHYDLYITIEQLQ
jgi:hypothetical protein